MNEDEIDRYVMQFHDHPILGRATKLLERLKDVVNQNSDGWCYWKVPGRAAMKLEALIAECRHNERFATEEKLKQAITPIKRFYTKWRKGGYGSIVNGFRGPELEFDPPKPRPCTVMLESLFPPKRRDSFWRICGCGANAYISLLTVLTFSGQLYMATYDETEWLVMTKPWPVMDLQATLMLAAAHYNGEMAVDVRIGDWRNLRTESKPVQELLLYHDRIEIAPK